MKKRANRSRQTDVLRTKIERLRAGAKPRVLDLFAGCGGISLGFQAAGFEIAAAAEIDELAVQTHARNFHGHLPPQLAARHASPRDITVTEPDDLTKDLDLGPAAEAFDVIVGGPPCQAYARVGRAKLREIAEHPQAFKVDPRGNLYLRYLHYVAATQPLALLIENVPDVLNYGGHNVMAEIAEALDVLGYTAKYSLINAAFHGVPQMRDRVFLIAYRRELGISVAFPSATNHLRLPSGYDGTRSVALRHIDLFSGDDYVEADHGAKTLPGPVTCQEALGDLPPVTLHLEGRLRRGARRFDELIPYPRSRKKLSVYAHLMRNWPGFENSTGVYDHVIRCLPRDTDTFREMPNGAEYPAAHATATAIWERRIRENETALKRKLTAGEKQKLHKEIVPPYPVGSFPNRWWKLRPDWPSRTLMAHIGKDTYSHIHYDSAQARVISVREAARLQSFPDGFTFAGTMNPAYRQIGNAVPPIMAREIASVMMSALQSSLFKQEQKLVAAE
ncbi:MAG: DNA cytosine methyltransferase [Hyphomicrobiaceae bacterium]|nr:DNA cytosine methyltransferase [Hyphomicrobiaceae bacterium]